MKKAVKNFFREAVYFVPAVWHEIQRAPLKYAVWILFVAGVALPR